MMGRFLQEENESVFSSRSASPSIFDIHDKQNTDQNGLQIKKESIEQGSVISNNQLNGNNTLQSQGYGTASMSISPGNHQKQSWRTSPNTIAIGTTN